MKRIGKESLIQNSTNLLGVGLSVLIGFVFMMFAWGAPALYYRKETRKAVAKRKIKKATAKRVKNRNEQNSSDSLLVSVFYRLSLMS